MPDKIKTLKRIIEQKGFCVGILCQHCFFEYIKCGIAQPGKDEIWRLTQSKKLLREDKLKRILNENR